MELSEEQQIVMDSFKNGENIFMTGPGGSGKTFIIRELYKWCKQNNKEVQVCALTGCAALLLQTDAKTIHSWAGIGIARGDNNDIIKRVIKNKYKVKNWLTVEILIIDEISMMSAKLLTILDGIGRGARGIDKPFGGIQLLFSGDFYQLPPVGDKTDIESCLFCFENPIWNELFDVEVPLVKVFRQTDEVYSKILNEIREGTLSRSAYNILNSRCIAFEESNIKPTKLMPRRTDANIINENEMAKLETKGKCFTMKRVDLNELTNLTENDKQKYKKIHPEVLNYEYDNIKNSIMAEVEIVLKEGSQVMCISNIDLCSGANSIVNGSVGVIVGFQDEFPIVEFKNGVKLTMGYKIWESDIIKGVAIKQIPLILAWAVTIHKSQGATLELAEIDIGSKIFEAGQTYVALSRVKNIEGLYLKSFNPQKIKINKKVKEFYSRYN